MPLYWQRRRWSWVLGCLDSDLVGGGHQISDFFSGSTFVLGSVFDQLTCQLCLSISRHPAVQDRCKATHQLCFSYSLTWFSLDVVTKYEMRESCDAEKSTMDGAENMAGILISLSDIHYHSKGVANSTWSFLEQKKYCKSWQGPYPSPDNSSRSMPSLSLEFLLLMSSLCTWHKSSKWKNQYAETRT